jgi:hypothetical protein
LWQGITGNNQNPITIVNKSLKTAVLAASGFILASHVATAQYSPNDLVLGFDRVDNGGVGPQPADYIINLGNFQTGVGVGGAGVMDLSSLFSPTTFNSIYTSLSSGVAMGVVGGNGATTGRDIFTTVLRSGAGAPNVPGSSAPGSIASAFMANGANDVAAMSGTSGLNLGAGQFTTKPQSDANSFNTWILSSTPPSYSSGTGIDPRGATGGSVLYEDLYQARNNVNGNNFAYIGYFTLDMRGPGSLTFSPSTVPEPSSVALLVGGAAIMAWLRRRTIARNA